MPRSVTIIADLSEKYRVLNLGEPSSFGRAYIPLLMTLGSISPTASSQV